MLSASGFFKNFLDRIGAIVSGGGRVGDVDRPVVVDGHPVEVEEERTAHPQENKSELIIKINIGWEFLEEKAPKRSKVKLGLEKKISLLKSQSQPLFRLFPSIFSNQYHYQ